MSKHQMINEMLEPLIVSRLVYQTYIIMAKNISSLQVMIIPIKLNTLLNVSMKKVGQRQSIKNSGDSLKKNIQKQQPGPFKNLKIIWRSNQCLSIQRYLQVMAK
jgi:hypothetical protein